MHLITDSSSLSAPSRRRLESLERTAKLVTTDRPKTHGDAEIEMGRLAVVWSGLLQHKLKEPLTEFDAAAMMVAFKACRAVVNPQHQDNWDDAAGYSAIGAGISEARKLDDCGLPKSFVPA